jgi:hypothetical protein
MAHRDDQQGDSNDSREQGTPDRDLLFSRIVDGRASDREWRAFESLAAREPSAWRDLACAHRDQRFLEQFVGSAGDAADAIDLRGGRCETITDRGRRVATWGGWAIAATLALAYLGVIPSARTANPGSALNQASLLPASLTPEEAYQAYMNKGFEAGRVLGELPDKVLVSTSRAENGEGIDIVFVRQIVERTRVNNMYQFNSQDELGNRVATPVRVVLPSRRPL